VFERLGRFTVRRRRLVLAVTALFVVVAAGLGGSVFGRLQAGGFDDPSAESSQARRVLLDDYGAGDANLVLLAEAAGGVDAAPAAADGAALTARLAAEAGVTRVASYWSLGGVPALRSTDGTRAVVVAHLDGDEAAVRDTYDRLAERFRGPQGALTVRFGGVEAINHDMGTQIERDLVKAEAISVPVTIVLLVLVFGGLVAAGMPLLVALVAIVGTFLALFSISLVTDVSIYAVNLTTALGLGLAIDYSLFIVSRFREELAGGRDVTAAVVRTVETAGRTVAFSALTVAASLAALLVFPLYFLRSFAYAGTAVVVIAALGSVVSLPALLAVVCRRIDRFQVLRRRRPGVAGVDGFWHRLATFVMRRPVLVGAGAIALLVALGLPFARVSFGLPDARALPEGSESRVVAETLERDFAGNSADTFAVVAADLPDPAGHAADLSGFAQRISALPGVAQVQGLAGTFAGGATVAPPDTTSAAFVRPGGTWLTVTPSIAMVSAEGEALVKAIRALDAPFAFGVEGRGALLVDTKAAIFARLPWALAIIAVVTFVLLFLVFGSLLVPAKAIVLNLLSLSATFGAMVWVFQQGHLSSVLDFTATGQLDVTMPILMFCIAFGLSMDYEVFLLSRIKEEHDLTGDNAHSVAMGLERTGRIVTAAAVLLAVTFVAFATSGVSIIKLFGVGLALAIVMDATIIRGLLVPAFMRLAGEANWWTPAPLRRFQQRFGIHEGPAPGRGTGHPAPELVETR
jgi:RND superfamily putative drug exporter